MARGKQGKQVAFEQGIAGDDSPSTSGGGSLYRGFTPDSSLREVAMAPRVDCSALGEGKELWLLQLPMELDPSKHVRWTVDRATGGGAIRAHTSVDGRGYELVSDRDTSAVPLYVTPGGSRGPLARVTRRLTVLRTTQAPQICFGVEDHHPLAGPAPSPAPAAAAAHSPVKKAAKRKLQPAAVAPVISEPHQAVPPSAAEAAPNKSNLTAYSGGGGPAGGAAAAGEGGAPAGAEGKEKKKKEKKEKRKAEEAQEAGKGSSNKEKKRKKEKKEGKD